MTGHPDGPVQAAWRTAYETASTAASALPELQMDLHEAVGRVISRDITALTDLPSFDSSAMDGWIVAGRGPWKVSGRILAGDTRSGRLQPGQAMEITTGAAIPDGARGVLRYERGQRAGCMIDGEVEAGADIRRRGLECHAGDVLAKEGEPFTPALAGLAAAAGHDRVWVRRPAVVDVLVLGDELLDRGCSSRGRVRDALSPMLAPWLQRLGAVVSVRRCRDDLDLLTNALAASTADILITTGGTGKGAGDHVHAAMKALAYTALVNGVSVRPGHPMVLAAPSATRRSGRLLIGLPGNPLAAVSGLLTLVVPVLHSLNGRRPQSLRRVRLDADVQGHPSDTLLVPVRGATPLLKAGPAMLMGLARADALAVIPEGGAAAGQVVDVLEILRT